MKIVIDIPEEMYQKIKETNMVISGRRNGKRIDYTLFNAVNNSTPLPKGHGRLGDLDALEKEIVNGIKAGNYEEGYDNYAHINNMDDCVDCVRYADAIIEADKVE